MNAETYFKLTELRTSGRSKGARQKDKSWQGTSPSNEGNQRLRHRGSFDVSVRAEPTMRETVQKESSSGCRVGSPRTAREGAHYLSYSP